MVPILEEYFLDSKPLSVYSVFGHCGVRGSLMPSTVLFITFVSIVFLTPSVIREAGEAYRTLG